MLDALKPDSKLVRYGTLMATGLRMSASLIMLQSLSAYSGLALTSNVTGLAFSHTKPGVAAETGLMFCALTTLGIQGVKEGNSSMIWMAGVGMIAFGNAFAKNIRYTKLCPKKWRSYEAPQGSPVDELIETLKLPPVPYEQNTKTQFSFGEKTANAAKYLLPATWIRAGAQKLAQSKNDRIKQFGEDVLTISQRRLFTPGTTAIAGVTPFLIDNLPHLFDEKGWQRAVGGLLILAGQSIFSISIPRKQNHPLQSVADFITGKNRNNKTAESSAPEYTR